MASATTWGALHNREAVDAGGAQKISLLTNDTAAARADFRHCSVSVSSKFFALARETVRPFFQPGGPGDRPRALCGGAGTLTHPTTAIILPYAIIAP